VCASAGGPELWATARDANPLTLLASAAVVVAIYKVATRQPRPCRVGARPRRRCRLQSWSQGRWGRLRRRSCGSTTDPTPRSLCSWPSRARSTTSHRAGTVPYALLLSFADSFTVAGRKIIQTSIIYVYCDASVMSIGVP
jgi:hypothetical protein